MTQEILIRGDLVQFRDYTVTREATLQNVLPLLERKLPVTVPLLPPSTVAAHYEETATERTLKILCEVAPGIRTIHLSGHNHRLSFPWTYFVFVLKSTMTGSMHSRDWAFYDHRIFHAGKRYQGNPEDPMFYPAFLPNVYDDGNICFGSTGASQNQNITDHAQQLMNEFYVTRFNHDLHIRYPNGWRGYARWVQMTRRNVNGWQEWSDWASPGTPLISIVTFRVDRMTPRAAADPIPAIPMGATFGRINEWIEQDLSVRDRIRLLAALTAASTESPRLFNPDAAAPVEDDEEDMDDEDFEDDEEEEDDE